MREIVVEKSTINEPKVHPKKGMEYIYLLDMVWKKNVFEDLPIEYGTIMIDVEWETESRLGFTHKETGERYYCHYGWALAENTPENQERIDSYERGNEMLEMFQLYVTQLRDKIIDLDYNL